MFRAQKGFSLIEVMIAFAVTAIGLLAIASFQSNLFSESGTSKAKAEALSIAQARLDEFRNYSSTVADQTGFDTTFTAVTDQADGTVDGKNATFTKTYTISGAAEKTKTISINVSWADAQGTSQSVALSSNVGFESPRTVGDLANNDATPLIDSATGRAHLGEGTTSGTATGNGDGTGIVDEDGDRKLTFGTEGGENVVVLTLDNACTTGTCTDFVKIKGRVYIDTSSQNTMQPGDVFVKASDAAFCHRYYLDALNGSYAGNVTNSTTTSDTPHTANGDYEVFEYTCYLGGGWHGNIGILLTGGIQQSDKFCQGDPTSANSWEIPVIAARRAYRGMLYKKDADGNPAFDAEGMVIYASIGVQDGITLPDPNTSDKSHDYVIAKMAASDVEGEKCITAGAMMRTDSDENSDTVMGDRFAGNPTDFVCLNGPNAEDPVEQYGYIDYPESATYPVSSYGSNDNCPFDPTDPPVSRKTIAGTITVSDAADLVDDNDIQGITLQTSDGPGNCTLLNFNSAAKTIEYSCNYYLWSDTSTWTGTTSLSTNTTAFGCAPNQHAHSAISADQSDKDYSCSTGTSLPISGSVSVVADNSEDMAAIVDNISLATSDGIVCALDPFDPDGGTYTAGYECEVIDSGSGWTGNVNLSLNSTDALGCISNQTTYPAIDTPQNDQNYSCGELQSITISGTVATAGSKELASASMSDVNGSCTVPADGLSYTCTTGDFINFQGWSGTVNFTSDNGGDICYNGTDTNTGTYGVNYNLTANHVDNGIAVISGNNSCP